MCKTLMVTSLEPLLKIGELAHQSGVPIKTIRYYEDFGLLQASSRTEGQFRLFDPQIIQRLHFIKRLQTLGLSLQEIAECLSVYDQGELPCHDIAAKLAAHLKKVSLQIDQLTTLRSELTALLQGWSNHPTPHAGQICPNLDL